MSAQLKAIDAEPLGEGVKNALIDALEMADGGEISSVVIAYVLRDGSVGSMNSIPPSRPLLVGAVEYAKWHLIEAAR